MSLNPALEEAGYCPRCGAASAEVELPRSLRCGACGYAVFFNPKPVGCAIAREADGRVWLARRGFEPQRGRWSMPGGFVDLGETVQEAIARELEEELEVAADVGALVGVYSRSDNPHVVIVFEARCAGRRGRARRRVRAAGGPVARPRVLERRCRAARSSGEIAALGGVRAACHSAGAMPDPTTADLVQSEADVRHVVAVARRRGRAAR